MSVYDSLSLSQLFVLWVGLIAPFFIIPSPDDTSLKTFLSQTISRLMVMALSMFGWCVLWVTLFNSQWYKGVQEAVGFTLGF